jgi:hypothetical protein
MDKTSFESRLEGAKDIPDIFELVKQAVRKTTGKERSGLMLGLSNLGGGPDGFVGAYYPVATNIIVMNTMPLDRIRQTDPSLYKPYIFHILLHEYIHALGTMDEGATREKASEISAKVLGVGHPATELAKDMSKYLPKLVYPVYGWKPETEPTLQLVKGFDRSSTDLYIN